MEIALAKDIMTTSPYCVEDSVSVRQIKNMFEQYNIRHLPVLNENGDLVGIVSQTDLNRLTFGKFLPGDNSFDDAMLEMLSIDDIMIHQPICVEPYTSIDKLVDIFTVGGFHAVPVTENERLCGIISAVDLIRFLFKKAYLAV